MPPIGEEMPEDLRHFVFKQTLINFDIDEFGNPLELEELEPGPEELEVSASPSDSL
jgi:hypothetical protein